MPVPIAPAPITPTTVSGERAVVMARTRWSHAVLPCHPGPSLSPLENGFALGQERLDALGVVRGATRLALHLFLICQLGLEIDAERAVEGPLGDAQAAGGLGGK